jgi:mRNA interferase MazF
MAGEVNHGDLWMYEFSPPDKLRPVLVLARQCAIDNLRSIMVAPITSTIRGLPSEVRVGIEHGLRHDSAVNLDHVQTVSKARLRRRLGKLRAGDMAAVCRALRVAAGCD